MKGTIKILVIKILVIIFLMLWLAEILLRLFTSSFYIVEDRLYRFRRDIDPERKSGIKIAMLGDSFTYGVKVDDDDALPNQLQQILRERMERDDIYVDNFGIPGTSSIEHFRIYEKFVEKKNYDIVVLNFFIDDFTPYYYYNTLLNEYKYCRDSMNGFERFISIFSDIRVFEFIRTRYDLYETSKRADGFITPISYMILKMREANSLRYRCAKARLVEMGKRIKSSGKKGIFMLIPSLTLYDAQNPYPEEIANYETMAMLLAKKSGFEVIDTVSELPEVLDQRHLVKNDIHYNGEGYGILAGLLAEKIILMLKR